MWGTKTPHNFHVCFPSLIMTFIRRDMKFDEKKAMRCSLERELQIPPNEKLLAPKEEPQEVTKQPKIEDQRVETVA